MIIKIKKSHIGKPFLIEWNDATKVAGGWIDKEEVLERAKDKRMMIYTTGFLVAETKLSFIFTFGKDEEDSIYDFTVQIPKSAITKMTPIPFKK